MKAKEITYIAMMITIIVILGFFPPIPVSLVPAPIILQNAGIMLSGLLLGKKKGSIAVLLLLLFVALGFPFLSGGSGGMSVFFTSTSGYVFAYPIAAFFIGSLTEIYNSQNKNVFFTFFIVFLAGVLLINCIGCIGLYFSTNLSLKACFIGSLIFIPGDICKAIFVSIIANRVGSYSIH